MTHILLSILFLTSAGTVSAAAQVDKPITVEMALKQIGAAEVVVEMTVQRAKERLNKRGIIFLDSETDFKSSKNLGVAISSGAAAKWKEKGITDPAAYFEGKIIHVRGCVMIFETRPYLPVLHPDQIIVVERK